MSGSVLTFPSRTFCLSRISVPSYIKPKVPSKYCFYCSAGDFPRSRISYISWIEYNQTQLSNQLFLILRCILFFQPSQETLTPRHSRKQIKPMRFKVRLFSASTSETQENCEALEGCLYCCSVVWKTDWTGQVMVNFADETDERTEQIRRHCWNRQTSGRTCRCCNDHQSYMIEPQVDFTFYVWWFGLVYFAVTPLSPEDSRRDSTVVISSVCMSVGKGAGHSVYPVCLHTSLDVCSFFGCCMSVCFLPASKSCLSGLSACLICLSVCLSVCQSVCLSVSQFACLSVSLPLFVRLPVCPTVRPLFVTMAGFFALHSPVFCRGMVILSWMWLRKTLL